MTSLAVEVSPGVFVPAHEVVATVLCTSYGCTNERRYDRGVAVGLCEEHGRPVMQAHGRNAVRLRKTPHGNAVSGSVAEAAIAVVPHARRYDRALRRVQDAERLRDEAKAELVKAVKALVETVARDGHAARG